MPADPYDQSSLAAFLVSDAGEQFLVAALDWMYPSWQSVGTYFWKVIVERGSFEVLLQRAWLKYFDVIRRTPTSLQAFKVLTLNLASRQVAAAVEVQRLLGTV